MLMLSTILICAGLCGLTWSLGYYFGECRGIRDTERRWSDAVSRADAARKYGA